VAGLPAVLIMLAVPAALWLLGKFKRLCIPNYAKLHMEQQVCPVQSFINSYFIT